MKDAVFFSFSIHVYPFCDKKDTLNHWSSILIPVNKISNMFVCIFRLREARTVC